MSLVVRDLSYGTWLSVKQEFYKVFRVMACDSVLIMLADRQRAMGDGLMKNAYEVAIGTSKTTITDKVLYMCVYNR